MKLVMLKASGAGRCIQQKTGHLKARRQMVLRGWRSHAAVGLLMTGLAVSLGLALTASSHAFAGLPDGRGWEMVSPLDTGDAGVAGPARLEEGTGLSSGGVAEAAENGDSVTYASLGAFGQVKAAPLVNQYLSRRTSTEWATASITPPIKSDSESTVNAGGPWKAFASDLTSGLLVDGNTGSGEHPVINPPLSKSAPLGYLNYYFASPLGEDLSESFEPILTEADASAFFTAKGHATAREMQLEVADASPDLKHVVIETPEALTPGATRAETRGNLYEWTEGRLQQVNVRPDGTQMLSPSRLGTGLFQERVVSDSGNVVLSEEGHKNATEAKLYVFEYERGKTTQVDVSHVVGENGGQGVYDAASSDGKLMFFTDRNRLTNAAPGGAGEDLYEYNTDDGDVTDLTVEKPFVSGATVQGVLGASEDGKYVYFVAQGVLSEQPNQLGASPVRGQDNLYVSEPDPAEPTESIVRFVATLAPEDEASRAEAEEKGEVGFAFDWAKGIVARTARVSRDGRWVAFMSSASLTGYKNVDAKTGLRDREVYLYQAGAANALACASCRTDGTRPEGSSWILGGTPFEGSGEEKKRVFYQSRSLSESGQVFFDSNDAVVPGDTNGREDVYEYENGTVSLISGGTSNEGASFVDASRSGKDVFFITGQQLVGRDTNQLVDLYDARAPHAPGEAVEFPEPAAGTSCNGETCVTRGISAPTFGVPASVTFTGSGEIASAPLVTPVSVKGKVKRKKAKAKFHKKGKGRKRRKGSTARGALDRRSGKRRGM